MRFKTKIKLYEFIDKNEGTLIEISYNMNWSVKKTKRGLSCLIKDGLIVKEDTLYRGKTVKELIIGRI